MAQLAPYPPVSSIDLDGISEAGLVGLRPVLEIVKTLIYTGQITGERPASAIICAPIGSGKTTVLEKIQCKQAEFTGDFTARDASRIVTKEGLTHIMIGDFLSVLAHKAGTVALSLQILSKLTGETLLTNPWSGQMLAKPLSLGVISAIPPDALYDKKMKSILFGSGFASRFIVIRYDYTESTKRAIHKWIESDAYTKTKPIQFAVETGQYEVNIPRHIAEKINLLSDRVKNDGLGARAHRHLRALIKARARMNGQKDATESDYDFVESVSDFFCVGGRKI
jgi:hypothetical protein